MNGFDRLLSCAGNWTGSNRVQPSASDEISESTSQLVIIPVLRDTFIRIDQQWSWNNNPQSGSLLIGYDRKTNACSIYWIDTWHNGTRVMPLVGEFDTSSMLIARGHFEVPDSPDWGWRIEIQVGEDALTINMFAIDPNGMKEAGWVWSEYRRA